MSFDIFLFATQRNGDAAEFDRSIVERAFEGYAVHTEGEDWALRSPDGDLHWAYMSVDNTPKINCFSVNRPPFTERFWNAVFEVMRQTNTVLMWGSVTSAPGYCVAHADWASYLPPEIVEDGPPAVVSCGADIGAEINASF